MKLTPEELADIRLHAEGWAGRIFQKLLAHIDALETEVAEIHETRYQDGLKAGFESSENRFYRERDQLKNENEKLLARIAVILGDDK
jgi:hypothetical protein